MTRIGLTFAVTAVGILGIPAAAQAHIQMSPAVAAPGDSVLFRMLVPGELDQATTRVELQIPADVIPFSFGDTPGWKRETVLAADGAIERVVWTGRAAPDGFVEFSFLAATPEQPGEIQWRALQGYADGQVVRWIGPPDSEEPAAVTVIDADAPLQNAGGEGASEETPPTETETATTTPTETTGGSAAPATTSASSSSSEDGDDWLARTLAILGLVGRGRRARSRAGTKEDGAMSPRALALIVSTGLLASAAAAPAAGAGVAKPTSAPPPPCLSAQITDSASNDDGHHPGTNLVSGWFSEAAGRLQAVIAVRSGEWRPEHDDADFSAYALLFTTGGQTRYVRVRAAQDGSLSYDYGTYPSTGTFVSLGSTIGVVEGSVGSTGYATIDVPAATGATAGAVLAAPFALTYHQIGGAPEWVDHAPGGAGPNDPARGADYVVGSCGGGTPPTRTVAVQLSAPARLTGGGNASVTGSIVPARGGIQVAVTRTAYRSSVVHMTTTMADGTFALTLPVKETTRLRAVAEDIGSQTVTITMRSTVKLSVRRLRSGVTRFTATVRPWLPGRVLLLKTTAFRPTATTRRLRRGKFTFNLRRVTRGRYQAVFIPANGRATRSTSKAVRVR